MPVIKQKTVSVGQQKQRIGLKKLSNDLGRGGQFKYVVVDLDTNTELEGAFTRKSEGKRAFRQTVKDIERGMESAKSDSKDLGLGSTDSLLDPFEDDGVL